MSNGRVAMTHPGTKARIEAPERAVKIYEASGWEVAKEDAESSRTESSGTETGEAGPPKSPARKTGTTKEESK